MIEYNVGNVSVNVRFGVSNVWFRGAGVGCLEVG